MVNSAQLLLLPVSANDPIKQDSTKHTPAVPRYPLRKKGYSANTQSFSGDNEPDLFGTRVFFLILRRKGTIRRMSLVWQ